MNRRTEGLTISQAIDGFVKYKVVEGLSDTNNALTSFRINEVIRVLTIISTIMLPLTLVASFLGMNVYPMPLDSPAAFAGITVAMLAIIVGMLAFFRSKRWI